MGDKENQQNPKKSRPKKVLTLELNEKIFIIGFLVASSLAAIYACLENILGAMPIEWRWALSLLVGVIFIWTHIYFKTDNKTDKNKKSVVEVLSTFIFIYTELIVNRETIMAGINGIPYFIGQLVGFAERLVNFAVKYKYPIIIVIAAAAAIAALILKAKYKDKFKEISDHPCIAAVAGWCAIAVGCLYKMKFSRAPLGMAITPEIITVCSALAGVWLIFVLAFCLPSGSRIQFAAIAAELTFIAAIIGAQFCGKYPSAAHKVIFCTFVILCFTCAVALVIFGAVVHKLRKLISYVWRSYFKKKIVAVAVFATMLTVLTFFTAICIVRWSIFASWNTFIAALAECGAYLTISFAVVIVLFVLIVLILSAVSKMTSFRKGLGVLDKFDIPYLICFFMALALMVYLNFKGDALISALESMDDMEKRLEASLNIIENVFTIFFISAIAAVLVINSFSKKVWRWCSVFMHNEALANLIYNRVSDGENLSDYLNKFLPSVSWKGSDIQNYADGKKVFLNADQEEIIKIITLSPEYLNGRKKPEDFLPNSYGGIFALYITHFAFKVRDFSKTVIAELFGPFSPDGLILGAIRDLFKLFM